MNGEIQILLIMTAGVSGFSSYNSTPVIDNEHLFRPIIIPNITKYFERPQTTKTTGAVEAKDPERREAVHLQEAEQKTPTENYSKEESEVSDNSFKFSSRYSTKEKDGGRPGQTNGSATEIPDSRDGNESEPESGGGHQEIGERRSFSDRSDEIDSSEEEKEDVHKYFDAKEPEEWEVASTTNEPSQDSSRPTSFQSSPHPGFKNYGIAPTPSEEEEEEEKDKGSSEEADEKRSVDDYYNSGSKNYHSVQTPLSKIRYRGPHPLREDLSSEKITRLVDPVRRPFIGHKWPYSGSQMRAELEDTNEISESDENSLEEGIRKELKGKPKATGLELAVEKDEERFDEKRKYNFVKEGDRGKQRAKGLAAEEEKDHRRFPFQILKQYQVDEEPRYQPSKKTSPKVRLGEGPRSSKPPLTTTPRNIFKDTPKQNNRFDISQGFHAHQFLGPVVFNPNGGQEKVTSASKGLQDREKLDQDNLTNDRIQKSIFGTGSANYITQSFNHLEESEEMYNAILANIQSVFGLKTQTQKSNVGGGRGSGPGLEESKSLTWSLPLAKRPQVA